MQITSLTLTETVSDQVCSGLRRQHRNLTSDVGLESDQFTCRNKKPHRLKLDRVCVPFTCISETTNCLLIFWCVAVFRLSKADFQSTTFHKSPSVPASGRAELMTTVYNPISDSHSVHFSIYPGR